MRQRWISRLFKGMAAVVLTIAMVGSGLSASGMTDRDNSIAVE